MNMKFHICQSINLNCFFLFSTDIVNAFYELFSEKYEKYDHEKISDFSN